MRLPWLISNRPGKRTFLDVAIKNANLVCRFLDRPRSDSSWVRAPICEKWDWQKLYKVTGDKRYLDMAKYFVEETGRGTGGNWLNEYSQDHMPI